MERIEKIVQNMQNQIAQQAANYSTQLAVLQVDLEETRAELESLRASMDADQTEE